MDFYICQGNWQQFERDWAIDFEDVLGE